MTINEYEEMINSDEYWDNGGDDSFQYIFSENEEGQIVLSTKNLYVKDLNLIIKEGVSLFFDEDSEEFEPDCDITMFFDLNTKKFLYSETEIGPAICISNYLHGIESKCPNIGELELEIVNYEEIYDKSYEG